MTWIETPNDEAKYPPVSQHFVSTRRWFRKNKDQSLPVWPWCKTLLGRVNAAQTQGGPQETQSHPPPPHAPQHRGCHPRKELSRRATSPSPSVLQPRLPTPSARAGREQDSPPDSQHLPSTPLTLRWCSGERSKGLCFMLNGYRPAGLGCVSIFYSICRRFNSIWWCEMCRETRARPLKKRFREFFFCFFSTWNWMRCF